MEESASSLDPTQSVESILQHELAYGNVVLGTIGPVLGHLLANHDKGLFGDQTIAAVRGMVSHVARQLLDLPTAEADGADNGQLEELTSQLGAHVGLISHCHARAMEWQLASKLDARSGIDTVLSPMVQGLVASPDAATASTAMAVIASQARFGQQMRRMELPIGEIPEELRSALSASVHPAFSSSGADATHTHDRPNRLQLLTTLLGGAGVDKRDALKIAHAGVALFLTALAETSSQARDLAILATNERQLARLALALRAAGLKPADVEEQFLYLHPEVTLPEGFEYLRTNRATELLNQVEGGQHG